jgi:hypothetical protein
MDQGLSSSQAANLDRRLKTDCEAIHRRDKEYVKQSAFVTDVTKEAFQP